LGAARRRAATKEAIEQSKEVRRKEVNEEGGEMSKVRIHDLAKELKPEIKKNFKLAQRMGVTGALNVAGRRRKPPTKRPKKGAAE
jgi:hypothetical protein